MHQRGTVFCAHPIGRSPQANAGFGNGARGELQRRNRKIYQTEGAADFREGISRSIWPSKLGLSCDRILPERGILFFGGEVSVRGMFLPAGDGLPFPGEVPHFAAFLNAAFVGGSSGLRKPENSEALFPNIFQRGDMGG